MSPGSSKSILIMEALNLQITPVYAEYRDTIDFQGIPFVTNDAT